MKTITQPAVITPTIIGLALLFGAFINAMVILFFFNMYQSRPEVILSPGGLVSKIAQILLEVALVYVLAVNWKKAK